MRNSGFSSKSGAIYGPAGRLDPWTWTWCPSEVPPDAHPVSARQALTELGRLGTSRRIPVGVIGPRDCGAAQISLAEEVGRGIGEMGLTLICGGRTGIMEAASKGCRSAGGLTVGLLPGHDWREANADIVLPIATGFSEARNMIIAKSSVALIAIGGSYGTLSEIAYGLHFSKPVITLADAHDIQGTERASDARDALDRLAGYMMASATLS